MLKHRVILSATLLALVGCNVENPIQNGQKEAVLPESSGDSPDPAEKTELSYGLSTASTVYWTYVDNGWDAAAGLEYYYYIRDSDRSVRRSLSGAAGTWENMNFPGRANRIGASNGKRRNDGGSNYGTDNVAVVGEDGYIYQHWETGWVKMTNRGNFIDVAMDFKKIWAIGTNNLMYSAVGYLHESPPANSLWTPEQHSHITKAVSVVDDRPLISNTNSQLYWWNGPWIYKNATGVRDICGTHWAGHFNDWGNVWTASSTGKLNYYDGYASPITDEWNEWRATNVSRVGCSVSNRLIVVNFDRTTYIKVENAPL